MSESKRPPSFEEFSKQFDADLERQQKIASLEGMVRQGGPQAEKARKALKEMQRKMEEGKEIKKKGR